MKIYILSLFPELFSCYFEHGLVKKARDNGIIDVEFINFRDFTDDPHHTVDDIPFGGGSGMVIKPEPVIKAFLSISAEDRENALKIIPSARGTLFDQQFALKLSRQKTLIFFAGRYKGFDQRIVELMNGTELSIGDYVLQGGELPAMVMLDAAIRLIPGFLGDMDSAETDSFAGGRKLLSAPEYTRPRQFMGLEVPEVLLSGNHAEIEKWKHIEGLRLTMERRPELIPLAELDDQDFKILDELKAEAHQKNE
ncbi:tRNA (guanosine(37)-N1)-methyltransferase TrmD [bacterium]|nr:MAG: tRNA (guanosine(37)-N1)-methyltransferase TrmD [bacterium]